ncbi:MAG TPA: hypothetical protein P5571_01410 [Candidatus Krumholzibacteria bacterium]|nr:hypothetical protein [Candidatus Krumholzibacteria bacterium]HRX50014.1 hypothetical protein [Candidatus Krumholzibacteria bacterium]
MRFVTASVLTALLATAVLAMPSFDASIYEVRTGVYAPGSVVEISGAVVTAVQANSFTVTSLPAGPYTAIWVYEGAAPTVNVGDVVDLRGLVRDNAGRAEINLLYPTDAGYTVTGTAALPALFVTTIELFTDPEAYESHVLTITDGMIVQELLAGGLWRADSVETQLSVIFGDYFFDYATVDVGDCYNNAYGMFTWYQNQWVFKVLSVEETDCTVANEDMSLGAVKALFR